MRKFLALAALVVAALTISVASASAFCGPGFTNKTEAAAFYHSPEGSKFIPSLTHELQSSGLMPTDQTFWAFFDSPSVVVVNTPKGYNLTSNTSCSGYLYVPYHGRYSHSDMPVLAVRGKKSIKLIGKKHKVGKAVTRVTKVEEQKIPQPDGSTQVYKIETLQTTVKYHQKEKVCYTYNPFEKGYCRNFVKGPLFKICKASTKTTHVAKEEIKKSLIRTEPAPKAPETPKTPETPKETPKEKPCTSCCEVSITGGNTGNVCGGEITCSITGSNDNNNELCHCANVNEVGFPNNCHVPTCEELGICEEPKEPTCQELGNCEVPRCKEGETGTPPHCEIPAPQISLMGMPAHVIEEEDLYGYIEAAPGISGHTLSVNVTVKEADLQYGHISGLEIQSTQYDKTPCPAGVTCYRFHIWGEHYVKNQSRLQITATATSDGKTVSTEAVVPVEIPVDGGF